MEPSSSPEEVLAFVDKMLTYFKTYDLGGDGVIDQMELALVLRNLDPEQWTDANVEFLMASFRRGKDGAISLTDFLNWVVGKKGTRQQTQAVSCAAEKAHRDNYNPVAEERARKAAEEKARKQAEEEALAAAKAEIERKQREEAQRQAEERARAQRRSQGDALIALAKKAYQRNVTEGSTISGLEFASNMQLVGLTHGIAEALFAGADIDHDGYMDSLEFLSLIEQSLAVHQIRDHLQQGLPKNDKVNACDDTAMQDLLRTYRCWDTDGDGIICADELSRVMHILKPDVTSEALNMLHDEIDIGHDGQIDFCDWVEWLYANIDVDKTRAWHQGLDKKLEDRKAETIANIRAKVQRKRADEARAQGKQREFEEQQHKKLRSFCKEFGIKSSCDTLNHGPGAPGSCKKCRGYHFWFCHYCGYINYRGDCINRCNWATFGWSCISGRCRGRDNCGCNCTDTYLRKHGFAMDTGDMNFDIEKIHNASHATQDAALLKKDVVVVVSVQQITDLGEGIFNLRLSKLTGDEFQVQVPAGASIGAIAAEVLKAGGYMNLIDLKLVMPDGDLLSENDSLPNNV